MMSSVLVGTEFLMPSAVEMPKLAQSHVCKFTTITCEISHNMCVYVLRLLWKTSFDWNFTCAKKNGSSLTPTQSAQTREYLVNTFAMHVVLWSQIESFSY